VAAGVSEWSDLGLPPAERERPTSARARRLFKDFVLGGAEDRMLTAAEGPRGFVHAAAAGLLALPVLCALLLDPYDAIGRWAVLLAGATGLFVAAQLDLERRARKSVATSVIGGFFYALVASGVVWILVAMEHPLTRIGSTTGLAVLTIGTGVLALRGDPRLCVCGSFFSTLGYAGVVALAPGRPAPAALGAQLLVVAGVSLLGALAAWRGRELRRQSLRDGATGALRGEVFSACLAREEARSRRSGLPLSLARVEITSHEDVASAHGSPLADAVLRWVGRVLRDRFRTTDLVARTGNREFTIAFLDADHPTLAVRLEALRRELNDLSLVRDGVEQPVRVRVTYSLAAYPREASSAREMFELARKRLFLARWRETNPA
jgi:diguanylate cyclase (GGDEF)-like protein